MKIPACILLFLLCVSWAVGQDHVWFTGSLDDAKAKAHLENKLIILDFSSDGH